MATIRLIPSAYSTSASQVSVSNAANMYANTDSTTYTTITHTQKGTTAYYVYLKGFDFSSIPAGAVIRSFTVKVKARETGLDTTTTYSPKLCNGTTAITSTCAAVSTAANTLSFTGVSASFDTVKGYGSNFGIRLNVRRAKQNTQGYLYIYGAEILVDYYIPVPHTVTSSITNGTITSENPIVVEWDGTTTITFTANMDYECTSMTVNGAAVTPKKLSVRDYSYTINNIEEDLTVNIRCTEKVYPEGVYASTWDTNGDGVADVILLGKLPTSVDHLPTRYAGTGGVMISNFDKENHNDNPTEIPCWSRGRSELIGDLIIVDTITPLSVKSYFMSLKYNYMDIANINFSNITSLNRMFEEFYANDKDNSVIDGINTWDVSNITDFSYLFYNCFVNNVDLSNWDTSSGTEFTHIFHASWGVDQTINISNWDFSHINRRQVIMWEAWSDKYIMNNLKFNKYGIVFDECSATLIGVEDWDVSMIEIFYYMFECDSLYPNNILDLSKWDTSNATSFYKIFSGSLEHITGFENWNTSKVTNFDSAFEYGEKEILDISNWDFSSAVDCDNMFKESSLTTIYNNYDWKEKYNITTFTDMFAGCANLVGAIPYDETKIGIDQANPFDGYFTMKTDIYPEGIYAAEWDLDGDGKRDLLILGSHPTKTYQLPSIYSSGIRLTSYNNQNQLDQDESATAPFWVWKDGAYLPDKVKDVYITDEIHPVNCNGYFHNLATLTSGVTFNFYGLEKMDMSHVTTMKSMFYDFYPYEYTGLDPIENWDVSNVENFYYTFAYGHYHSLDLSKWNTSKGKDFRCCFKEFDCIEESEEDKANNILNISNWDFSSVEGNGRLDFYGQNGGGVIVANNLKFGPQGMEMFWYPTIYDLIGVETWDVSKVENFSGMLKQVSFENDNHHIWDLSRWDVSKATNMTQMFYESGLDITGLENWDVSNVVTMDRMFDGTYPSIGDTLSLNLNNWNLQNLQSANRMFADSWINTIYCDKDWNTLFNITSSVDMFKGASKLIGAIEYDETKVDILFANPTTGYFTWLTPPSPGINLFRNGLFIPDWFYVGSRDVDRMYIGQVIVYEKPQLGHDNPQPINNLLDLSQENWTWVADSSGNATVQYNENNTLTVSSTSYWGINIRQNDLILQPGEWYRFSCDNIYSNTWISIDEISNMMLHGGKWAIDFTPTEEVINPKLMLWSDGDPVYDNVLWNIRLEKITYDEVTSRENIFKTSSILYSSSGSEYASPKDRSGIVWSFDTNSDRITLNGTPTTNPIQGFKQTTTLKVGRTYKIYSTLEQGAIDLGDRSYALHAYISPDITVADENDFSDYYFYLSETADYKDVNFFTPRREDITEWYVMFQQRSTSTIFDNAVISIHVEEI